MRCLFGSFVHFLIRFILLLLRFKSPLSVLNSNPLSDVSFANIFPQYVACHLILSQANLSFVFFCFFSFLDCLLAMELTAYGHMIRKSVSCRAETRVG